MVKTSRKQYTLKSGREVKELIVRPDTNNGVFTYKDIESYVNKNIKNIAPHKRVVVRALTILGDRTVDTFDTTLKNRKDLRMMDDKEYDDYLTGGAKDTSKFKHFFNFSVTISEDPIDNAGFLFV